MIREFEVVIIGAGLAGLTAGYHLQKRGIRFVILEARDRVGGRIHTHSEPSGSHVEMGATWFAEKHTHLMRLIEELQVPFQTQYLGRYVLYDFAHPQRTVQLVEVPTGQDPSYLFLHGSWALTNALSDRIPDDSLRLHEPVVSISFRSNKAEIKTVAATYSGDYIINTLPPNLSRGTLPIDPPLPKDIRQLTGQTHTWMGESIKIGLVFKEAFWRKNQIGTIFSQYGPIHELHDHMHEISDTPMLVGFLQPDFKQMQHKALQQAISEQLAHYFPTSHVVLEKIISIDWSHEPYTYQVYPESIRPHQNNGHPQLRSPLYEGRYYLGGSESAERFPGYMEGAVERASEIVDHIHQRRR